MNFTMFGKIDYFQLNQNVKTESVELETLTENTLTRSSLETRYASPWDFVEVPDRYSKINENLEKKLTDQATDFELPKNAPDKNYENEMTQKRIDKTVKNFFRQSGNQSAKKPSGNSNTILDLVKLWRCDICKKRFKSKKNLYQHMLTHNRKTYTCDKCPKSYSYKSTLRRHAVIHNEENVKKKPDSIVDRDYKVGVKKPKIDEKQVETKTPDKLYECDVCHKFFEKKSSMRVHIKFLHIKFFREDINKPQPEFKRKSFECKICAKRYTQSSHLYRHELTHLSYKMYHCEECNISFSRRSTQSRHMLHKHSKLYSERSNETLKKVEIAAKSYDCKICEKSFKTYYDLRRHCATHDGRKPYECDICKKQFALKSYLYAHVLTHDNWKPYPCDKCSKFYRRKSSLQRHVELSHTGKKSSKCNICHKVYKCLKSYNTHMENHH